MEEFILEKIYSFFQNPKETIENISTLELKWSPFFFIFIAVFSYVTSCSLLFYEQVSILKLLAKWIIFVPTIYLFLIIHILFLDLIIRIYGKEGKRNDLLAASGLNLLFATLFIPIAMICKFIVPFELVIYTMLFILLFLWIFKLQFFAIKKIYNLKNIEVFSIGINIIVTEVLLISALSFLILLTFAIVLV